MARWLLVLAIAVPQFLILASASAKVDCAVKNRLVKEKLLAKIADLKRERPEKLSGPPVPSGKCTMRAIRLGLTFGSATDFENAVETENLINCINIDIYHMDQECQCANANMDYVRDEEMQDDIFLAYNKMRKLEQSLTRKGIRDPAVKMLVSQAGTMKDCVNRQTLAVLNGVTTKLEALDR